MVVYPFSSLAQQLMSYVSALVMLGLDTTPFFDAPKDVIAFASTSWTRVRDSFRFSPMIFVMMLLTWKNKKGTLRG